MRRDESGLPFVVGGVLLAVVLVALSFQGSPPNRSVLDRTFAPRPADPRSPTLAPFELPRVALPELPADVQTRISTLTEQLEGGKAIPALTPSASGASARVSVAELKRSGEKVSVRGSIANTGRAPLHVNPGAFVFRDSAGVSYATEGSGAADLAPGESTDFDLAVPLPAGRGLTMLVTLPPDPPIEQVLLVELAPAAPAAPTEPAATPSPAP